MKIEITETVEKVSVIDVELPYYYKHDLMSDYGDSVIYGKIEAKLHTAIQETENYDGERKFEIEKEEHSEIKNSGLASYFGKEHQSNQKEFEAAKQRCMLFVNGC